MGGGILNKPLSKKGFTLLELLAVIIVLAVIALITIPIVTGVMKDAKKNSFKTSMNNLVKAADNYYADNQLSINSVMTFCFGLTGSNCATEKLKYSGKEPDKGKLIINPDGEISLMDLSNGTYYANYDSSVDDEIVITEDNEILNRDELTQAIKDLKDEVKRLKEKDTSLQTQLTSTTTIANTANNTANSLNTGMLNKTYPVGSIYISYSSTNPSSLFGGAWVAYGAGRTLVGMDTSQIEFNTIGKTGGEKSHILTVYEMPRHLHNGLRTQQGQYIRSSLNYASGETDPFPDNAGTILYPNMVGTASGKAHYYTGYSGADAAHNNLQPYITVYMWRRTA